MLFRTLGIALPNNLRKNITSFNLEHKAHALEELLAAKNSTQLFEALIANQSQDEISNLIKYSDGGYLSQGADSEPLQQMMKWDLQYYLTDDLLVKVDRATMYHGIECREPLLDHRLIELASTLPVDLRIKDGTGKFLERKILQRYIPKEFYERKKQGFSIPIFAWFSEQLDSMFKTSLSDESLSRVPFLNATEVRREYKKYLHYKAKGKQYNIEKMWRILSFMLWWDKYMIK